MVNMGDLLSPRIGAPIRVKSGRIDAVRFDAVPFVAANAYPFLEYMDKVREERSGVSRQTQGLDPASLKDQSIYGMSSIMSAATQKIEYVARAFGECGIKDLMRKIRALSAKYADKQEVFQVAGNRFSTTDPRAWTKMRDMRVLVGVGNTGIDQRSMALQLIQTLQEKIIAAQGGAVAGMGAPMVDAMNVYNSITDTLENFGVYEEDRYFKRPNMESLAQLADQPPPPNPAIEIAKQELQQKEQSKLVDSQIAMAQHQDNLDIKREDNSLKRLELQLKYGVEDKRIEADVKKARIDAKTKVGEDISLADSDLNEGELPINTIVQSIKDIMSDVVDDQKQSNKEVISAAKELTRTMSKKRKLILDDKGNAVGSQVEDD
jgi:tRNA G37 N-methylase TrmD